MRKNRPLILLSVLIMIILIGGIIVGEISGKFLAPDEVYETGEGEDNTLVVVGISQLGSESVWRSANTASIQSALSRENGYFSIFSNARQKQENQVKAIRNFISQGVDYIVFAPVTEDGWDNVLREAKEAGIPVILMDRTVNVKDPSLYVTHVGSDMHEEGIKAGMMLESILADKGMKGTDVNIIVLKGTSGSTSEIGRTAGFREVASSHPEWKILAEVDADFTTTKAKEEMEKLLKKHDKIDVLVSQNDDMTFGAIEAMREKGITVGLDGEVAVISFDAGHQALTMVYNGLINADIECNPIQGEYVSDVIRKLERGEPVEKEYFVSEQIFTKDNVEEYLNGRLY